MSESLIGKWVRVSSGPQKGQMGVAEAPIEFPVGRRYRVVHPHSKTIVGRFPAEQLTPCDPPDRSVTRDLLQPGLDLIMGRRT